VSPGDHRVLFAYHAYPFYWILFAFGALVMAVLVVIERRFMRAPMPERPATPEPVTPEPVTPEPGMA